MRRLSSSISRVLLSLLIMAGTWCLVDAPATNAAAAVRVGMAPADSWWCGPGNGSECNDTDPYATGCAATKHYVMSMTVLQGTTRWQGQLYYSSACQTIWSRLQLLSGTNACSACYLEVIRRDFDNVQYASLSAGNQGSAIYSGSWTNQLYMPCGQLTGDVELWNYWTGTMYPVSNDWSSC